MIGIRQARNIIKTVTPVKAKNTEHRKVYSYSETCSFVYCKRIEIIKFYPAVSRFKPGATNMVAFGLSDKGYLNSMVYLP